MYRVHAFPSRWPRRLSKNSTVPCVFSLGTDITGLRNLRDEIHATPRWVRPNRNNPARRGHTYIVLTTQFPGASTGGSRCMWRRPSPHSASAGVPYPRSGAGRTHQGLGRSRGGPGLSRLFCRLPIADVILLFEVIARVDHSEVEAADMFIGIDVHPAGPAILGT